MQTFPAVFQPLRNIEVCQMKELLEDSGYLWVWEGIYNAIFPYTGTLQKLHRSGRYLEKSWNFALTKGKNPDRLTDQYTLAMELDRRWQFLPTDSF